MTLTLNLTADDPHDIADLVNQALDHDRGDHSVAVTPAGDITIMVDIRSNQRAAAAEACGHPADLADPVHCDMLAGHAGDHSSIGLTWGDDGAVTDLDTGLAVAPEPATAAAPEEPSTPKLEVDYMTPEREAVADRIGTPVEVKTDHAVDAPAVDPELPMTKQILALPNSQPDKVWTSPLVAEHIDGTTGTISTVMGAMAKAGRITKVARGQYQAIDRTAVHDRRRQAAAAGMFGS